MNSELLSCPFCPPEKSDPRLINAGVYLNYVKCCSCGCASGLACSSEEQAMANWNRRTERTCRDFGGEEGTNGEGYDFACSACGWCGDITEPNFCPNCGAMVVG